MAEVIFNYEGTTITIQCNMNNQMKDVIDSFLNKITEKGDNFFYLYNGSNINKQLTFNEQANNMDKDRKKMNIIVNKNDVGKIETKEVISKDIVCPECKENILLNIKNYRINLYGC